MRFTVKRILPPYNKAVLREYVKLRNKTDRIA